MDKITAQRIVRETFKAAFDKGRYRNFVNELCNQWDESKAQMMRVPEAFAPHIKTCQRTGTFESSEGELADVLIVYLTESYKLERTRTALRDFVAHKLKRGNGDDNSYKEAALVAFVAPDSQSWRFSYVRMEYETKRDPRTGKIKPEERLTPARRYSYLVGEDEECHTAQSRFLDLLSDTSNKPTLQQIEKAFSVESVTWEFFNEYARLFVETEAAFATVVKRDRVIRDDFKNNGVNTVDFAKKLLGQIVFLYFIQKKGWLGVAEGGKWGDGPRDFLRQRADLAIREKKHLFNDVLEPLFYDTLAVDRGHDAWCRRFQCRIPFLNGGLFEPLTGYDWKKLRIEIPNSLFTNNVRNNAGDNGDGILDVFDRYNFTVNEAEPLEKEVAIDPEMLGKVFENLIEENRRKGLGTYYTPREIVYYMCQESLINYLDTKLNTRTEPVHEGKRKQAFLFDEAKFEQTLLSARVRDERIPRADIEKLIREGEQAAHYEAARKEGTPSHPRKLPKSIENHARALDNALATITVCDPAIGSGAFPVGMMTEIVRARSTLTLYLNDSAGRTAYHFKRHAIQCSIYGVDIDHGAVEIAKLRLWLSLVVDEENIQQIKPLPNLDYKVVAGNSLLGIEKDLFNIQEFKNLESLKPQFFDASDHGEKSKLKKQIEASVYVLTNGKSTFDFQIYFSEVFHHNKGFDIVIANPPYVGEKGNKELFEPLKNSSLGKRFHQGKMDLFYFFIHLSLDLLRDGGLSTFITTNYYITATGARKLVADIKSRSTILRLINFNELKIFESALGQHNMITLLEKGHSDRFAETIVTDCQGYVGPEMLSQILSGTNNRTHYYRMPQKALFVGDNIKLTNDRLDEFLNRMRGQSRVLSEVVDISQGLQSGLDQCFILDESDSLYRSKFAKPYFKNSDIVKYAFRATRKKVLYVDNEVKAAIFAVPEIRRHLAQFKEALQVRAQIVRSKQDWYSMLWPRKRQYFTGEKIVCPYRAKSNDFALVNIDWFCGTDVYMIMSHSKHCSNKFILGLLNSKVIGLWLKKRGARKGEMLELTKDHLSHIPIPIKISSQHQETVVRLVERMLSQRRLDIGADISTFEQELDKVVYNLYEMQPDEILLVEDASKRI